ncbi:unnamed protein product [Rotaria sp. Silwood2]|nr:unnamed protein product [Rotaria sp. Silwood2]CAF4361385.1 unnamed protein product [Rotaria sp. Silwood2]
MKTRLDDMKCSRWDELRLIVEVLIEIGAVFDSSGIDVYFLDRPPILNISELGRIDQAFALGPQDYTPLACVLRHIFDSSVSKRGSDKKLLVLVAMDGEPTNEKGDNDIAALKHVIQQERRSDTVHVAFLACTDDESAVAYLDEWDRIMTNVCVTVDYRTERDFVHQHHGHQCPFSFGDYISKALLSAIDPKVDVFSDLQTENNAATEEAH